MMKPIVSLSLLVGLALLMAAQTTFAQDRLSWEFRAGVDFPTEELGNADLNTGFGFEGTLAYRFMPHLGVYAGWGWHRFTADDSFAGPDTDFEETGYTFGLQFMHPLGSGTSPVDIFVRAGAVYNHVEVETDGDISGDSDHELGWQAGAGVALDLGNKWKLMPGVRYRAVSNDIEIGDVTVETDLNYIEVGVGISRTF